MDQKQSTVENEGGLMNINILKQQYNDYEQKIKLDITEISIDYVLYIYI